MAAADENFEQVVFGTKKKTFYNENFSLKKMMEQILLSPCVVLVENVFLVKNYVA
jgi:hypothetical protein